MAADDPRRTIRDLTCDRDDIAALQLLYDAFTHADRVAYPTAEDLRRVRRIIRDLDRGYTKAFGAMPRQRFADRIEAR
jgi:hypothetical protein